MGFATMENISFANRFGLETVLLRAFTAVPAHLVFGVVAGYYVGLAKFDHARRSPKNGGTFSATGRCTSPSRIFISAWW